MTVIEIVLKFAPAVDIDRNSLTHSSFSSQYVIIVVHLIVNKSLNLASDELTLVLFHHHSVMYCSMSFNQEGVQCWHSNKFKQSSQLQYLHIRSYPYIHPSIYLSNQQYFHTQYPPTNSILFISNRFLYLLYRTTSPS